MTEIGEAREKWGRDIWNQAEAIANRLSSETDPFYIVFAAKPNKIEPNKFHQVFKMYRDRPPALIGILVWYVDPKQGIFRLEPELSIPYDVPVDPSLLSTKSEDQFTSVMQSGEKNNILLA